MIQDYLSKEETEVAHKLLTAGLKNASRSFSSLARQNIDLHIDGLTIFQVEDESLIDGGFKPVELNKKGELVLLTTELIGEMHGKSYLVFNSDEAQEIFKYCLPKNIPESEVEKVQEAVLKEIDNILSAAVITEFSNFLDIKVFGDVPYLFRKSMKEIETVIYEDLRNHNDVFKNIFMTVNSKFIFENQEELCPSFVWKLTEQFLDLIKNK